jgi:organic radical activating enzyme
MNKVIQDITTLPVMERFYTIQGEGFHQGRAAYFIRLAGCDVGCVWCDVKESWESDKHPLLEIEELIYSATTHPARLAVITGGEPCMHSLEELTNDLHREGFETNLETSGSHPITGSWDWVCLSPKKFKAPLPENLQKANELKVIIFNHSDFAWAEKFEKMVSDNCKLYLQPEWSRSDKMMPLIVEYIMNHPQWQLSLQVHKFIGVP